MPATPLKQRNSSIELYRIIATITVLIVHFNGWFVGGMPEKFDLSNPSAFKIGQMIIEAATCICVNMFLIISGYFGIRLKLQSVVRICLLLVLIYVPFYLLESLLSHNFKINGFISHFFVISRAGYFIQCYMMLMFLSPVLNAFIEKNGRKSLKWVIIFFALEIWFGCVRDVENLGYNHGYSVIHFVLIYMLARCVCLYKFELLKIKRYYWFVGYFICTIIICMMYIFGLKFCWDYSNPIVVVSSLCSFIPFLYYDCYNKYINWIAGGTLAVYIIQVTNPVYSALVFIDNYLLVQYSYPIYLLLISIVISSVFFSFVFYGKGCDWIAGQLLKRIS